MLILQASCGIIVVVENIFFRGCDMSFVPNSDQQISLFTSLGFLSDKILKMLNSSWAQAFSDHVFPNIDETIFAPLFSQNTNSRPNSPVNVLVGALILKELNGLTDEELVLNCNLNLMYQYALHTMSFGDQPISTRSLSRFRERVAAYEVTTDIDLVHECVVKLSEKIREYMDIDPNVKRMDSMMIEANIRRMSRVELLYTCISNLVKMISKDGRKDLIKGLEHYADPNDRNRVIYHDTKTSMKDKFQKVIDDASLLIPKCEDEYSETEAYQLLLRAIGEQTKDDGKGGHTAKQKGEGMDSTILQNPSDPDATFRVKAGEEHQGYVGNITEAVSEKGSVITDYQYDQNIRSDESFLKEAIENTAPSEEPQAIIADGAYDSREVKALASEKNITVVTTGLSGRKADPFLAAFVLADDLKSVVTCPAGNAPKSSSYSKSNGTIRVSFDLHQCEGCPYREQCHPAMKKRTAVKVFSVKSRAKVMAERSPEAEARRSLVGRIRNGVETVPSLLRNKFHVDKMPVRRKLRTKLFFGFKVAAANCIKLSRYEQGLEKCRAFA